MSTPADDRPDWLKNYVPDTRRGNPAWEQGMPSPNAAGRPRGIVDRRNAIAQELARRGKEVAEKVANAACAGDMAAAALVLLRLCPPTKAQAAPVRFPLDTTQPLAKQAAQVVQAVADGELDPGSAQLVGRRTCERCRDASLPARHAHGAGRSTARRGSSPVPGSGEGLGMRAAPRAALTRVRRLETPAKQAEQIGVILVPVGSLALWEEVAARQQAQLLADSAQDRDEACTDS